MGTTGGLPQGVDLASGTVVTDGPADVPRGDFYLRLSARIALGSVDSNPRLCERGTGHATLEEVSRDSADCVWAEEIILDDNVDFAQTTHVGDGFFVKSTDGRGYRGLITGGASQGGATTLSFDIQQVAVY
jgi:hypothetical protein